MALAHEQVIPLWPGRPKGTPADLEPVITERSENLFRTSRVITGVSAPSLTAIVPEKPNGVSLIAAPGGGYRRISLDAAGYQLALELAPLGITTFMMIYRLPGEGHENAADVPLMDAQRAVRLIRRNAADWGLSPDRIGFLGSSAAGHMAASVATAHARQVYAPMDDADQLSARPDFLGLMVPVITMQDPFVHNGSREALLGDRADEAAKRDYSPDLQVTSDAPETFLVLADDDQSVPAENGLGFYAALRRAGVPAELHVFRDGGHTFSVPGAPVRDWSRLFIDWLRQIGMLD
ncbi:alpha/beta hydrolase [Martelella alba]|uniref:Alpha/beta hydrolase n=1 Tax=Martelella alba TaxID=2590451 RepID=A0A506UFB2_9HYPH|nr:alpha/beta hydrolase [Martelella alba]TPW31635.1 alpha/beta hydrolase [Martelella alba]